ncbi:hypothetical protein [Bacillus haynesii]|uniref:hypothetical protein n=1 Tax=Bacillus haynesii TaxID=1925021 RepID=UPI0022819E80|nr:hypothetical protein [Bacillus haynesii]MCY8099450.1 hypothetical protein [Bacillus haynesii]MCY9435143.1 hypothetical protein [Bacillus haynesii]MEC0683339.1 hypothetical protein [Bacillus haynesii]MEC1344853.1 hypothetical protein [Bacillus haynesii]
MFIPTSDLTERDKELLRQQFAEMLEGNGEILIEFIRDDRATASGALAVEFMTRLELRCHKTVVERNAEDKRIMTRSYRE